MKETSKSISHKSMSLLLVSPVLFMYSFSCIFCGGYAEFGMIGPLTFSYNFGNDSMLLPNGIVLLGNVDNELISNGVLTPNQLLQMGGNFS